jgi:hypothetical protein
MAIVPDNLEVATGSKGTEPKRIHPDSPGGCLSVKFAPVATDIALLIGTPVSWNDDLEAYQAWDPNTGASGAADEVQTIDTTGTPTGGTFTLSFNGQTTTPLDFDATAAEVDAALEALSTIDAAMVVSAGGPLPTAITVTFSGAQFADSDVPMLVADYSLLTGGTAPTVTVVQTTEGTSGASPAGDVDGFVYPSTIEQLAAGEVFGTVMFKGTIHRDDIVLPTVGAPTESQLDAALREGLIAKGLIIQGLSGIH